jgi:hypothetical protein
MSQSFIKNLIDFEGDFIVSLLFKAFPVEVPNYLGFLG